MHLRHKIGQLLVEEILALEVESTRLGLGCNEIANAAAVEDYFGVLEIVERAKSGVGVDAKLLGDLADGGDALVGFPFAIQDTLTHGVGYLEIYGFLFLKVHDTN